MNYTESCPIILEHLPPICQYTVFPGAMCRLC